MKGGSSSEKANDDKDLIDTLRPYLVTALIYSVAAAVIYVAGHFLWWLGFVLFIIFALFTLQGLLFVGFVAFLEIWVSFISFAFIRKRGMNLNRVDELKQPIGFLLKINLLIGIFELYFNALTFFLGGYFLFGWFSYI